MTAHSYSFAFRLMKRLAYGDLSFVSAILRVYHAHTHRDAYLNKVINISFCICILYIFMFFNIFFFRNAHKLRSYPWELRSFNVKSHKRFVVDNFQCDKLSYFYVIFLEYKLLFAAYNAPMLNELILFFTHYSNLNDRCLRCVWIFDYCKPYNNIPYKKFNILSH